MPPQHKVVFVNRFFYPDHSATSQILTDLAFDLARDGYDIHVVASRLLYDNPAGELPPYEVVQGVKVHRVWSTRFGRDNLVARAMDYFTFYLGAIWSLWRLAGRDTVLVAKTDPPLISLVVAPVARLRQATLVNWLQDLFPEVAGMLGMKLVRGPVLRLLQGLRNASLRAARTNVVLGRRMEALVRGQGIPGSQVRIIPNWADGEQIVPVPRAGNPLRQQWGLDGKFVVGYSGNLGRAHEFNTILDAAERLSGHPDIVFLFIGGGAQRDTVEEGARRRGLQNLQFQPYQPRSRLAESLGVADVHLVSLNPALEGLIVPSKFYGVAAAGRATLFVGDPQGEVPQVLQEAGCGFGVGSGDPQELVRCITALAGDRALCESMGRNARAVFDQRFERKLAVAAWKEVLAPAGRPDRP